MILYLFLGLFFASAQEENPEYAKAKQAYVYGTQLFEEGDYMGAIQAFDRAYSITQKYEILFNIALAYQFSGDLETAKETFIEYQRVAPTSQWNEAQTRIENIEALLAKKQKAALETKPEPLPPETPKSFSMPKSALYSLWGLGAVGLTSGAYFGVQQSQSQTIIDAYCIETICKRDAQEALVNQKSQALYSDIGWGVGLVAVGSALWFTMNQKTTNTHVSFSLQHISLTGSFQ